ncbi:MAG: hypothetical protein QOC96_1312 [Acidobacteriota bacterium]|jgi:hypothetical protein|nr:hypothetical protein [Acidobacteriota bacterium]
MSDESTQPTRINLIRMDDGRWRVFIDDADMGAAFQFPWDALQCALNGSLTGQPISNLQAIEINANTSIDQQRLARARAAQAEQRALLAALRGIDGEGI